MARKPTLVLVKGCGRDVNKGLIPRPSRAANVGPVNVGPDSLTADFPGALTLHVDGDGFADLLLGRDGLPEISDSGSALSGEPLLLVGGEFVQVRPDAFHAPTLPVGNFLSIPAGHLPDGKSRQNRDMQDDDKEKQKIRHRRLLQARKDSGCKTDKEFAERIEVEPSYFSNLKHWPRKGSKPIGDICRAWETLLGLPIGWFDREDGPGRVTPIKPQLTRGALELARIIDDMDQPDRVLFERLIEDHLRKKRGKTG